MALFDLNPKESPKELFGREKELDEITRLIKARRWVAVLGPRMVGKTSLLKAAGAKLEEHKIRVVYVNLWGTKGTNDLLKALARGLNEEKTVLQKIKSVKIEGVTFGSSGIGISVTKKPMTTTWDLLDAIGRQSGDCVIELDEVQELIAISGRLLKILANMFNTHSNITFVFTGSMFGLMKTLLEPESTSPLYGRSPAKLHVQPFETDTAKQFLQKGFLECSIAFTSAMINEAVERLDGIPGWLTLYGNKVSLQKLPHKKALEETTSEASKIVKDELEHFLEKRDRQAYMAALKASAAFSRWNEIKSTINIAKSVVVNDVTVYRILENLKAAMLIRQEKNVYKVEDPMLREFLLASGSDGV
jgi:AAA+ ATPase superfamily predicted ATPase